MPRLENDRGLLDAFRKGERQALEVVYREYAPVLARMLRASAVSVSHGMLRSSFEIENVVEEAFARAFEPQRRLAYDGLRPYEAYLWGIARNCAREIVRRREDPAGLELPEPAPGSESAPDALAEDHEVAGLMAQFEASLDPPLHDLYRERFDAGLSQREAARALRLSRIVLRRRERALKRRLLDFLQSRGYLGALEPRGWTFVRRARSPRGGDVS